MKKILGFLGLTSAIMAVFYAISWGLSCFLMWLITLCFGMDFSLLAATGIWLIFILIRLSFNNATKRD